MASSLESAEPVFAAANGLAVRGKKGIDDGEGDCFAGNCSGYLDPWLVVGAITMTFVKLVVLELTYR